MTDPDFPEELRAFIRDNIPDVDAAELLLVLARSPGRTYDIPGIVHDLRPTAIADTLLRRHLDAFTERGLLMRQDDNYRYQPNAPELDVLVRALMRVYNERPVTMVRTIYAMRDEKIRSFADAFRLKKT